MAEGEEPLGSSDASIAGVAMPRSEATTGGTVEVIVGGANVEVRLEEPLLPLQDPWYYSTSLFPAVGAPEVNPPGVPKKWILKGKAPNHEIAWVPAAFGIIDLRFQRKELLPAPIQFLCPYGKTVDRSDWVEQEGETTVTLKDMERICLLPSVGDVDPLELGLSGEEFVIAGKLLETFGGTFVSWGRNRARLHSDELEGSPYHIIESSINVVLLQTFIWEHSKDYFDVGKDVGDVKVTNWVVRAVGPNGELQFLGFEDGLPLLMKWMGLKVWNFPSITLLDDGAHFAWKPYSYVATSWEVEEVVISPPSRELFANTRLIPNTRAASAWATRQNLGFTEWQSGASEGTQSEGYDLEYAVVDFSKLLFLASVSSHISSPDILCSLGPTDEDIEMAGEPPVTDVIAREYTAEMLGQGLASEDPEVIVSGEAVASKGLDVTLTAKEAVVGVPSHGHVVSSPVHDLLVESSGATIKGMSLEEFLEKFAEDEENDKVATDFYTLSNDIVMFQWSEIPAEGQPLLATIVRKHSHFMTGCKLGASLRKC
nr:hypothetical protein CFP56_40367 [Quercus suber]